MIIAIIILSVILFLIIIYFFFVHKMFNYIFLKENITQEDLQAKLYNKWQNKKEKLLPALTYCHNLPFQEISIKSKDNLNLKAHYLDNNKDITFILVHGYRSSGLMDYAHFIQKYIKDKYNILLINQRSHLNAEGKYITFGHYEKEDLLCWVNYIKDNYNVKNVFIYGTSMGCATLTLASKFLDEKFVKGIICDCGYSSIEEILKMQLKKMNLPIWPLFATINMYAKIFMKFSLYEDKCYENLKDNKIPVLFLHGDNDKVVPLSHGIKNYEACNSKKEIFIGKGALHAHCFYLYEEELIKKFDEFLTNNNS